MATIQRAQLPLPKAFDDGDEQHRRLLENTIAAQMGAGWEISSIAAGVAHLERRQVVTAIEGGDELSDMLEVRLPTGTKAADGDRHAARLSATYEGFTMTDFDPHLGTATLERMSPDRIRARDAIATVLGCKAWEIKVTDRLDGGFTSTLTSKYVPSAHDPKLLEAAEQKIGEVGWRVETNPAALVASFIPGEPPNFEPLIRYPFASRVNTWLTDRSDAMRLPLGEVLGGGTAILDLDKSPHTMLVGTTGSGKSNTINGIVTSALAAGMELVIVDDEMKAVDFGWAKEFCRSGGWGCESLEESVTALTLVHEEGARRAHLIKSLGYQKVADMPVEDRPAPILVVVDELTVLLAPKETIKGLPKSHPLVARAIHINTLKGMILEAISEIAAKWRFVDIYMLCSTQVAQNSTGIPTSLRNNLTNRVLLGGKATTTQRNVALADGKSAPVIPGYLAGTKGIGVFETTGSEPGVFKSYFAEIDEFERWLTADRCIERTGDWRPKQADVLRITPTLESDDAPIPPSFDADPVSSGGETASFVTGEMCESCGTPVRVTGECGCTW